MRRRTVLAAVPALLAGCLDTSDGNPTTRTTRTATRTPTATATETVTETPTNEPTPTEQPYEPLVAKPASMTPEEVKERLDDRDCAELAGIPATCPGDGGRLDVSVSPTVGELTSDVVEFTITNRAVEPFKWGAYNWSLQKWDGNRWWPIAPLAIPASLDEIPGGEFHTYRIQRIESEPIDSPRAYITDSAVTLGGLGPGVYGFSTEGYFESTPDDEFAAGATFGFAGKAPPITPTDGVSRVERDGSELVVSADPSAERRGRFVVSLVSGAPDVRLLPEHVHQLAVLRNTLPYAGTDGVEAIRFLGSADHVDLADSYLTAVTPDGATRLGFDEYVFEVSSEES